MSKANQLVEEGIALHRAGRLRDAASAYQRALAVQPKYGPALRYLGFNMAQQGLVDMGRALLEQALAVGEEGVDLRVSLAQLRERAGQFAKAAEDYRVAAQLAPTDASMWGALARALGKCGDANGARAALQSLLQHHPDNVPALVALLRDAYQQDDLPAAMAYFERVKSLDERVLNEVRPGFALPDAPNTCPSPFAQLQIEAGIADGLVQQVLTGADLHLFDDFLPDPDAARVWALGLNFAERGNYPGLQTGPMPCEEVMQQLANRLGQRIKWISPDNGVVRLTLADASARTDIHVDDERLVETNTYAAVLYLSLPEHCHGGTSFWRHGKTGWLKRPDNAVLRDAGYADFKTFLRKETPAVQARSFDELSAERDAWQRLFTVPMRYNRLVLYKGNYFHAIDSIFGSSHEDGRLTRLFTFECY